MMTAQTTRRGKTGVFAALLLVLTLILSACGATVDTNLNLAKDGSGSRTITAKLSTENLSDYVDGGLKAISDSLKKHTPEQLEFKGLKENKEDSEAVATFEMSFSSFDDYETKINGLLTASGSEQSAEISTVIENNDFVSGFATDENFSSSELLGWAEDGLVNDGVVSEEDASGIFTDGEVKVKYDGKNYESDSTRVSVNKVKDNGFDQIYVNTTLNADGSFSQQVIYEIAKEKATKLGDKLTNFLSTATVAGELEDYYGPTNSTGYSQTFEASNVAELAAKTGQALGSEKISYEYDFSSTPENPTQTVGTLKSSLDCDTICSPSGERIATTIRFPQEYEYVDGSNATSSFGDDMELEVSPQTDSYTVQVRKSIPLKAAELDMNFSFNRSIEQTYTFSLAPENAELIGDGLAQFLDPGSDVGSFETKQTDDAVQYIVKISAESAEALNQKLGTYAPGASVFASYEEGFQMWPEYYLSATWDPSEQLGGTPITNGVSANVSLPFWHSFTEDYIGSAVPTVKGGTLTVANASLLEVERSAKGPTIGTFIALGVLIVVLLIGLAVLFNYRKHIRSAGKKAWDQRDKAINAGRKAATGVAAAGAAAAAGVGAVAGASIAQANTAAQDSMSQAEPAEFSEADLI
ncbi:hypothetical protein [Glutamicibacter protophormiae]